MISGEPTTTPLGTGTAQNHFSTKAERMLVVTNATEYVFCVCVCALYECICKGYLASESRGHRIPDHTPARHGEDIF